MTLELNMAHIMYWVYINRLFLLIVDEWSVMLWPDGPETHRAKDASRLLSLNNMQINELAG